MNEGHKRQGDPPTPKPLLRSNVASVYRRGGTQQNTTMEMTYEELQRNLGLGVDIG